MEVGMATKITVALEDDLDGGPPNETVRFGVGGAEYEIDLNNKNAAAFLSLPFNLGVRLSRDL
jgi:Lsr2